MTIGEAVSKRINELLFSKGWSLYKLSKESCIPLSTLKNLYVGHTKCPTLSIIFKISDALGVSVTDFLTSPLFNGDILELD